MRNASWNSSASRAPSALKACRPCVASDRNRGRLDAADVPPACSDRIRAGPASRSAARCLGVRARGACARRRASPPPGTRSGGSAARIGLRRPSLPDVAATGSRSARRGRGTPIRSLIRSISSHRSRASGARPASSSSAFVLVPGHEVEHLEQLITFFLEDVKAGPGFDLCPRRTWPASSPAARASSIHEDHVLLIWATRRQTSVHHQLMCLRFQAQHRYLGSRLDPRD